MKTRLLLALIGLLTTLISITPSHAQISILFDYSFDTFEFFSGANIGRRTYLEAAASALQSRLGDTLDSIIPGGDNSWSASFSNPSDGSAQQVANPSIAANTLVIYAGGRNLSGGVLGIGGPGGFSASGTLAWLDTVSTRGETGAPDSDFGPWGGSITFDTDAAWHFDSDPSTIESFTGFNDFYSVALHELGHVLGTGTATSWNNLISGGLFNGPVSVSLNNGNPVPVTNDNGHWASDTPSTLPGTATSQETAMDPELTEGTRKYFTDLDFGGLDDLGWDVVPVPEPAQYALIAGLGLLGFAAYRRRRAVAKA